MIKIMCNFKIFREFTCINVAFEIYDSANHDVFKYLHIMQSRIRLCLVTTAERRDILT